MNKELYDKLDSIEDSLLDARDDAEIYGLMEVFEAIDEALVKVQSAMSAADPTRFAQR